MAEASLTGKKRKRRLENTHPSKEPADGNAHKSQKLLASELEQRVQDSQRNLNDIAKLIDLAVKERHSKSSELPATYSLCRVFCRLYADGALVTRPVASERERVVQDWLKERLAEYWTHLTLLLNGLDSSRKIDAVLLSMQIVKAEGIRLKQSKRFSEILSCILTHDEMNETCQMFAEDFAKQFDDVRHTVFKTIRTLLDSQSRKDGLETRSLNLASNALSILLVLDVPTEQRQKLRHNFCDRVESEKSEFVTISEHKKAAQRAWLSVLSAGLDRQQRKHILDVVTVRVVPWLQNVELLMDFLTDSYDEGGATSLLALSGLFHLMQEENLDYPDFYKKLYSLLDASLLHSKHRSRFFRFMNMFLSSTHLPAALVASFIKRLSRLALHGPPAGIVAVTPWVYNMLKSHPTCTFMIHRVPRSDEERQDMEDYGADDPFDMEETDPMQTGAIDSCLWELETLQSHYHPNVASLARIISEQFTKTSYNLEDFLDHSYHSLIDAELHRELRKIPVVEFEIPKKIFVQPDGDDTLQRLMDSILE